MPFTEYPIIARHHQSVIPEGVPRPVGERCRVEQRGRMRAAGGERRGARGGRRAGGQLDDTHAAAATGQRDGAPDTVGCGRFKILTISRYS